MQHRCTGGHRGRGGAGGRPGGTIQPLEGTGTGGTIRGQAIVFLERDQGILRLLAENAIRNAVQIPQGNQALLKGIHIIPGHPQGHGSCGIGVRRGYRRGGIHGRCRKQLRLGLDTGLAICRKTVSPLERLHGIHRGGPVKTVRSAGIIPQLGQPCLDLAHLHARGALFQQDIPLRIFLRTDADHLCLGRRRIQKILRLTARNAVCRQSVLFLEFHDGLLGIRIVLSVNDAAVIAQLRQPCLQI